MALGPQFVHGRVQVAIGTSEAHDEQVGIVLVAQHLKVGHLDVVHLLLAQARHQVVVLGVGADGTGLVVLFEAAQDVGEALAAGHGPIAHALSVTLIGCPRPAQFLGHVGWLDGGIFLEFGQAEGCRAVGDVGIGEQYDGGHVLECHLRGLVGGIEAVGGREGCHHGHGALAVAAEEHLQEVGLLRLGGQARGGTATLHVEHDEGQLHDDGQVHGLRLQADAGSAGAGHGQCSAERGTQRRGAARDFVFALHGGDAQRLMFRQFVEHVGGRSDGIAAQIELEASLLGSSDEAVGRGLVAGDVHVAPGHLLAGLDAIDVGGRRMGVVTIVVACLYDADISLGDGRFLGELLAQEVEDNLQVATEQPAYQTDGKHVAALEHRLHVHARIGKAFLHHRGQGTGYNAIGVDAHLGDGIVGLELGLLQVLRAKGIGVDDDGGLGLGIAILGLQRCGIHGHQHVALISGRVNHAGTDVHLIAAHSRQRALRGAYVGRIVGEGADTVSNGC